MLLASEQIVAALVLLDALNNAVGGVLSGLGMQRAIAASQLAGYYAIGIPAGVALAMMAHGGSEDGVYGLWIGTTMAMGASLALQCTVLARHSWDRSLDEAQKRLQDGQLEVSPAPGTCKIPGGSGSGSSRGELVCPSLGEGGCAEMIVLQEGLNNPIGTRHLAISCQRRKSLGGTS